MSEPKIRRRPLPPEYIMRRVEGVPLHFLSNPEDPNSPLVEEKFSIEYKSYTTFGFVKLTEEVRQQMFAGEQHMECEIMARSITAIMDSEDKPLTGEDGEPAGLDASFFVGLLDADREAIQTAIREDANPQKPSSPPGDSMPKAEASAASA